MAELKQPTDKRYVTYFSMYTYAPNDKQAITQANEFASKIDKEMDNACSVSELFEQPEGTMKLRKII